MLCEKCGKKEATCYYRENVNGTVKSYRLCPECAAGLQKSGEIQTGGFGEDPIAKMMSFFSGDDFFGGDDLFGKLMGSPQRMPEKGKTCALCGGTFQDMVKSGKAGCPRCYETFAAELTPSIQRIHGRTVHTGQAPARFREENEKKQKIAALEAELKEAIQAENYERAAEIRDSLRDLRKA
ncbi:MAG: UvrB/UvrC motif-containing protein [Clostridia bacterium]|nr:UvrB/UvrC motif-containing protein [Clostridia bacterium]